MNRRWKSVRDYLSSHHSWYKENFDPGTQRAHAYIVIGYLITIPFSLSTGHSEVVGTIILASIIFAGHEYMGQRIRRLFQFLSCRYELFNNLINSYRGFKFGTIVAVDLLIGTPLVASNNATELVFSYFYVFVAFVAIWYIIASSIQEYINILGLIYHSKYNILLLGIFGVSLVYYIWHTILFRPDQYTLAQVVSSGQCPTTFPLGCIGYAFSTIIVHLTVLLLLLVFLGSIILLTPILVILGILLFPSLVWPQAFEIAPVWRLWISITILTVVSIQYIPNSLTALDYVREWRAEPSE